MVDKVTNFNFPATEHVRWAHAQKDLEESPLHVQDAFMVARSSQLAQTTISPSFFDQLFRPRAKGPVHDEEPKGYSSQSMARNDLFGSVANLDSLMEVIMNLVNQEKKKVKDQKKDQEKKDQGRGKDESEEEKREINEIEEAVDEIVERAGTLIVDMIKARKEEDINREFVKNKMGSLRQG